MKRRSRLRAPAAVNYWPGYVDALTNVVLNLLFLIAMFGIALTVLNNRAGGVKRQGRDSADQDGPMGGKQREESGAMRALAAGAGDGSGQGGPVRINQLAGRSAPTLAVGAPGDGSGTVAGAARGAGSAAGGPVRRELAVAGSSAARFALADGRQRRTEPEPASVPAGKTITGATSEPASPPLRSNGPGRQGGGYAMPGLPGGPLDFGVVDAYQRRYVPGVRILRRQMDDGQTLLTVSLARGTEPVTALQQGSFRTSLIAALARDPAASVGRVRVWAATRLIDPTRRRTAYLALIAARNQLLALGYPPAAIEMRLIEGGDDSKGEQKIYILVLPVQDT